MLKLKKKDIDDDLDRGEDNKVVTHKSIMNLKEILSKIKLSNFFKPLLEEKQTS